MILIDCGSKLIPCQLSCPGLVQSEPGRNCKCNWYWQWRFYVIKRMSTFRSCYWRIRIVGSEIFCWRTWPKCFWSRNRPWLFCLQKRGLPAWGGHLCWRYVQVHDKQKNLPQISLVQETQEKLDPQSFLTLPSWPQCWRTSWRMFLTLSTPKMALRCNLTMVCR